jgi:hypothetical protein
MLGDYNFPQGKVVIPKSDDAVGYMTFQIQSNENICLGVQ